MLLTRKACYGIIVIRHLADDARKGNSFSAKELAELYGLPEETLAKILQHLAKAGLLHSRHGINGGYCLACDPQVVTVLDVIKASEPDTRLPARQVPSSARFDPLLTVRHAVESALGQLTIANI